MFMKRKSGIFGFTLIELLVVIAIIGVLASIVLASLNSARRKSRDARRITDLKQIQLALELSFDGSSPPQYPEAKAICDTTANAYGLEVLATGGYIPQVPRDPQGGCYRYASNQSGSRTTYHLGASIEESTNPALNSDKDCNSTGTPVSCPLTAAGAYAQGFDGGPVAGDDTGCDGTTTTLRCYDVIP